MRHEQRINFHEDLMNGCGGDQEMQVRLISLNDKVIEISNWLDLFKQ